MSRAGNADRCSAVVEPLTPMGSIKNLHTPIDGLQAAMADSTEATRVMSIVDHNVRHVNAAILGTSDEEKSDHWYLLPPGLHTGRRCPTNAEF